VKHVVLPSAAPVAQFVARRAVMLVMMLVATPIAGAQSPAVADRPSSRPPVVHEDGRVSFALLAPQARSVSIDSGELRRLLGPETLDLVRNGVGRDDFLLPVNRAFTARLRDIGVRHDYEETAGNHTWGVWRLYLAGFLPRLFREEAVRPASPP
jgi:enterochelin esterase-like enzyme